MLTDALTIEAAKLRQEVADLEEKRTRLDLIEKLLKSYSGQNQPDLISRSENEGGQYAGLGITEAVQKFLATNDGFHQPIEIRDKIVAGGFKSDSPNLLVMITSTCKRKVIKGALTLGEKDGQNAYKAIRWE